MCVEYVLGRGDIVVATLRKPEALETLQAQYTSEKLLILHLDVTSRQEIVGGFKVALERFGRIDVVFNNAGYGLIGEAESSSEEATRAVFETNFWGAVNVSNEAIKVFREVNKPPGGRLLNNSSITGLVGYPFTAFYCASKHGELP